MSDDWDDELPVEALEGSSPGHASGSTEELNAALLDMTATALKLGAYVADLDDSEFPMIQRRLGAFVTMVLSIPRTPLKKAKKVGFRTPVVHAKKPTKKKPAKKKRS